MRIFTTVSVAAVLAATLFAAPDALAQRGRNNSGGGVATINYGRVASESVLGRDMQAKIQQIVAQLGQEQQAMQPEGQSIEQERQRLSTALRGQTPEQLRNNSQAQALSTRIEQFERRQQALQGDLQCTLQIAQRDLLHQMEPVVRQTMQERGASVVVDTAYAAVYSPDVEITTNVIQALDANPATRTASVARHAVTECQPAQGQRPAG